MRKYDWHKKGFTFIELLITMTVLGILLLIAIPSMQHLVVQNRVTTQVQQIVRAINLTRSEAIKRGTSVFFCKSSDGKNCGGNWSDGQLILAGHEILRIYPHLPPGDELIWSSSFGQNDVLEILPTGFTNGQNGSFSYCPQDQNYAKRIIINQSGRVRISTDNVNCHSK